MPEMDLKEWIFDRLAASASRDDILQEICAWTRCDWSQAESILEQVERDREGEIFRRRLPLLFALALVVFLAGTVLAGYGLYGVVLFFSPDGMPADLTTYFLRILEQGQQPSEVFLSALPPYLRFTLYFLFSPFTALLLGLIMVAGSLLGLRDVWSVILFKE
jgi:hypothetical protein